MLNCVCDTNAHLLMKLRSLILSVVVLHVLALGLAWVVMESPEPKIKPAEKEIAGNNAHLVALPSSNLAYPVLTLFGKSYLKGEHPNLMSDIRMDSLDYSGWNPAFYPSFARQYTDVYSFETLSSFRP